MVPCWDCKMLRKIKVETRACIGDSCSVLEEISMSPDSWQRLLSASEQALEYAISRYAKLHEAEHQRLLRFARKQVGALGQPRC